MTTSNLDDFIDLAPRERGGCALWHLELTTEGVPVADTGDIRIEVDELFVAAFDATSRLFEKLRESRAPLVGADHAYAHDIAGTRL